MFLALLLCFTFQVDSFKICPQRIVCRADIMTKMVEHGIADHHHTQLFRRINLQYKWSGIKKSRYFEASFNPKRIFSILEIADLNIDGIFLAPFQFHVRTNILLLEQPFNSKCSFEKELWSSIQKYCKTKVFVGE